jgi:BirA family biotin operon repressor/biotin-[acetyl-CoA-carboxylase] ligase
MSAASWLIELETCESTNSWALAHAEALAHGACVWTTSQTAGRGRGNSRWLSPPGVLTASFVLMLPDALAARQLSLAAGLAVAHAVEDLAPRARLAIKWPNDCLYDDRKIAGILCERSPDGRVVVGIGLNVDPQWQQVPQELPFAVASTASIAECCTPADKKALPEMPVVLAGLRRYLIEAAGMVAADGWEKLLQPLRTRDWLRGKQVTVVDGSTTITGIAGGFDAEGRLLVSDGGESRPCSGGSVTLAKGVTQTARSARWFRNDRRRGSGKA